MFLENIQNFPLIVLQSQASFWATWKDFEIKHGNEDTLREMLRIKRSVQATYNTQVTSRFPGISSRGIAHSDHVI